MRNVNVPQVFNTRMERLAMLDKAVRIGYRQCFNDIWTARFTLPADDLKNEYCQPFNYVEIFDERRRIELFRIIGSTFTRGDRGFITYELEHVITTLLDNVLFKFHQIGNIGVFTQEVINYVLGFQTVRNWRLGRCDFRHQFLYKWESENLLSALLSIPKPFMDEWHITYDTTVYPWVLNIVRAETEVSCEMRRRKNMQGITKEMDAKNLVTRIKPLGYGEGDNQLTIREVNNGVEFLDADTIPLWGIKETVWEDRRFEDAANMMATARKMLEQLKMPYISYSVDSIDLFRQTKQDFDKFNEGRVVRVIDRHDGIDLDTRIMEIRKPDVTKADITVVIANKDRNVAGSIAALQERARINDTYAQGSETPQTISFSDNAEPGFPAVIEFFIDSGMVNVNKATLRVRLERFRAFSRAIRGGGALTRTTTGGGGVSTSTAAGGATTQTTTLQAQQIPTTSTHSTQNPTTTTHNTVTPTTTTNSVYTPTTTTHSTMTPTTTTHNTVTPTTTTHNTVTPTTTTHSAVTPTTTTNSTLTPTTTTISAHTPTTTTSSAQAPTTSTTAVQAPTTSTTNAQATTASTVNTQTNTSGASSQNTTANNNSQTSSSGGGSTLSISGILSGGAGPIGTTGANATDGHVHSVPRHDHTINHSHSVADHTHTVNGHNHGMGHTHGITIPGHDHSVTIPGHNHSVTIQGHNHTVTIPGHSHSVTIPGHSHTVTIPGHNHTVTIPGHDHRVTIQGHNHTVTIPGHDHRVTIQGHNHTVTIQGHNHTVTIAGHSHTVTIPGHSHQVTIPGHNHTVTIAGHNHTVTIQAHGHSVTIPAHTHQITIQNHYHSITIPDHVHEIEYGIFQGDWANSISIRVDGMLLPVIGDLDHINIIPFLRRDGGGRIVRNAWHRIEIVPNRQTRIVGAVYLNVFTNSRGGENL